MFQSIQNYFATPPRRGASPLGARLSDEDDDPAIPAFQTAWKDGALVEDLFGPQPFALHGSVGGSGADNHRSDVAKVETLLGDAGYYKPMTDSGPNGWHNPNLDSAIRSFQKDKGLQVDGLLKPGGSTITAIGGLFGGAKPQDKPPFPVDSTDPGKGVWIDEWPRGWPTRTPPIAPEPRPTTGRDTSEPTSRPESAPVPTTFPQGTGLPQGTPSQDQSTQKGQPRLVQGPQIMFSEIPNDPKAYQWHLEYPDGTWVPTSAPPRDQGRSLPDRFPGHTISEAGAREHEDWAKLVKRDAKPEETARILNVAITDHGDQGAADAADLLGRFAQHDPQKAETLRTLVSRQAGREVPFRIAPLGEGFREPSMEEKLAQAPQSPFGPTDGADMEAAGSMAKALLKKGDYQDAYAYLKSAPEATPPYMAAVHDFMRRENPGLAMKFAEQGAQNGMAKPVQVAQAETGTMSDGVPASAPPPSGSQPASPSTPDDDIGRQLGMPVPGSEPAQSSPSPAPSGQPEPKPDEKPDPSIPPQWQPDKGMMSSGDHVTRTTGRIRIDRHSITPGLDGIVYNVEWFPLDKDGNVEPTIRKVGKEPDWGGHMVPGVEKDIHKPPYDHPNGWEVRVSIPPGQKYNNISGKPWLNILVPPKGQGRDRQ